LNDFFLELSKKESGKYYFKDDTVASGIGSRSPYKVYNLNIDYKNHKIQIKNEIGLRNVGSISCKLPVSSKQKEFSIRTRNHFFKLFRKDKKSFIIKCKNEHFKKSISDNLSLCNLEKYTFNTQFELTVYGKGDYNGYEIKTEYNLIFENRENVLIALIQFYKDLIKGLYIKPLSDNFQV